MGEKQLIERLIQLVNDMIITKASNDGCCPICLADMDMIENARGEWIVDPSSKHYPDCDIVKMMPAVEEYRAQLVRERTQNQGVRV